MYNAIYTILLYALGTSRLVSTLHINMSKEPHKKDILTAAKIDEFRYLTQIYKYMRYLEYTYNEGILKNAEKARQISTYLSNIKKQRDTLAEELKNN